MTTAAVAVTPTNDDLEAQAEALLGEYKQRDEVVERLKRRTFGEVMRQCETMLKLHDLLGSDKFKPFLEKRDVEYTKAWRLLRRARNEDFVRGYEEGINEGNVSWSWIDEKLAVKEARERRDKEQGARCERHEQRCEKHEQHRDKEEGTRQPCLFSG